MAYANILQRHASIDDWFDLHVVMIPCVWVSFTFCTLHDLADNLGLATARQTSRFRSEDKQMYVLEPYFSTSVNGKYSNNFLRDLGQTESYYIFSRQAVKYVHSFDI
jgi:hypothetical protein